jgi:hypothetical protein
MAVCKAKGSGWRLANILELDGIRDQAKGSNPYSRLPNIVAGNPNYWSSSDNYGTSLTIWLSTGNVYNDEGYSFYRYIRCVRGSEYTISGNLTGTSSFYKVVFNGSGKGWTVQDPMKVSAPNQTDTLIIKQGTMLQGNGTGDNLEVLGKFIVGDGTGSAMFTTAELSQGNSLTININSTSTPSCPNCIVQVGSATGSGTFNIKKNTTLQFNSATSVESALKSLPPVTSG